ncbi:MAG: HK97 family phage prohead protease [Pseudomonadota bacterium]
MLYGAPLGVLEMRNEDDGVRISGRFPYNSPATLSDGGRSGGRPRKERIAPGAFRYRIERPEEEIHLLVGHSYDKPLARTGNGTLEFEDTAENLLIRAFIAGFVARSTYGGDALAGLSAGLMVGLSPGFRMPPPRAVPTEEAEQVTEEDPAEGTALIRTIYQGLLYEFSLVTRPAYQDAEAQIEARSWRPTQARRCTATLGPALHPIARWR